MKMEGSAVISLVTTGPSRGQKTTDFTTPQIRRKKSKSKKDQRDVELLVDVCTLHCNHCTQHLCGCTGTDRSLGHMIWLQSRSARPSAFVILADNTRRAQYCLRIIGPFLQTHSNFISSNFDNISEQTGIGVLPSRSGQSIGRYSSFLFTRELNRFTLPGYCWYSLARGVQSASLSCFSLGSKRLQGQHVLHPAEVRARLPKCT